MYSVWIQTATWRGCFYFREVYNCLLDACIECKALPKALHFFEEMKKKELVDVVSYNTLMKGGGCGRLSFSASLISWQVWGESWGSLGVPVFARKIVGGSFSLRWARLNIRFWSKGGCRKHVDFPFCMVRIG